MKDFSPKNHHNFSKKPWMVLQERVVVAPKDRPANVNTTTRPIKDKGGCSTISQIQREMLAHCQQSPSQHYSLQPTRIRTCDQALIPLVTR